MRPHLQHVKIGERGAGFYQFDLDIWPHQLASSAPNANDLPVKQVKPPNELFQRGDIWHIDKVIGGQRICKSTGAKDYATAERVLAKLIGETFQAQSFGTRPDRVLAKAATYYLEVNSQKKSLGDDRRHIERLLTYGDLANIPIAKIHRGLFDGFVEERQQEGVSNATINHALKVVRQLLNQGANDWRDEHGLTWLEIAPKIKLLPDNDRRAPRVLTWPEQLNLFSLLPVHLRAMATFAVNTGCRESEISSLFWQWEKKVLDTSVFVLPKANAKNNRSRGRREILDHSSGRSMTNHYSAANLRHLMSSVELLCPKEDGSLLFDDIVLRL